MCLKATYIWLVYDFHDVYSVHTDTSRIWESIEQCTSASIYRLVANEPNAEFVEVEFETLPNYPYREKVLSAGAYIINGVKTSLPLIAAAKNIRLISIPGRGFRIDLETERKLCIRKDATIKQVIR